MANRLEVLRKLIDEGKLDFKEMGTGLNDKLVLVERELRKRGYLYHCSYTFADNKNDMVVHGEIFSYRIRYKEPGYEVKMDMLPYEYFENLEKTINFIVDKKEIKILKEAYEVFRSESL